MTSRSAGLLAMADSAIEQHFASLVQQDAVRSVWPIPAVQRVGPGGRLAAVVASRGRPLRSGNGDRRHSWWRLVVCRCCKIARGRCALKAAIWARFLGFVAVLRPVSPFAAKVALP